MTNCNENQCSTESHQSCCPVEQSSNSQCCPIEKSVEMWSSAFFIAMKEASVDVLKEKIKKNWGHVLDKKADAVLAAMDTHWKSVLAQGKAQVDLKDAFKKIYEQALQK